MGFSNLILNQKALPLKVKAEPFKFSFGREGRVREAFKFSFGREGRVREKERKRRGSGKHYEILTKQRPEERKVPHCEGGYVRPDSGYRLQPCTPNLKT